MSTLSKAVLWAGLVIGSLWALVMFLVAAVFLMLSGLGDEPGRPFPLMLKLGGAGIFCCFGGVGVWLAMFTYRNLRGAARARGEGFPIVMPSGGAGAENVDEQ